MRLGTLHLSGSDTRMRSHRLHEHWWGSRQRSRTLQNLCRDARKWYCSLHQHCRPSRMGNCSLYLCSRSRRKAYCSLQWHRRPSRKACCSLQRCRRPSRQWFCSLQYHLRAFRLEQISQFRQETADLLCKKCRLSCWRYSTAPGKCARPTCRGRIPFIRCLLTFICRRRPPRVPTRARPAARSCFFAALCRTAPPFQAIRKSTTPQLFILHFELFTLLLPFPLARGTLAVQNPGRDENSGKISHEEVLEDSPYYSPGAGARWCLDLPSIQQP